MILDGLGSYQRELPTAFRYLMEALTDSHLTLARYTQPSVVDLLQQGIDPTQLSPRKQSAAVLFSDIIGFTILAERLRPGDLLRLVNAHVGVCADAVEGNGGVESKQDFTILGDTVNLASRLESMTRQLGVRLVDRWEQETPIPPTARKINHIS